MTAGWATEWRANGTQGWWVVVNKFERSESLVCYDSFEPAYVLAEKLNQNQVAGILKVTYGTVIPRPRNVETFR